VTLDEEIAFVREADRILSRWSALDGLNKYDKPYRGDEQHEILVHDHREHWWAFVPHEYDSQLLLFRSKEEAERGFLSERAFGPCANGFAQALKVYEEPEFRSDEDGILKLSSRNRSTHYIVLRRDHWVPWHVSTEALGIDDTFHRRSFLDLTEARSLLAGLIAQHGADRVRQAMFAHFYSKGRDEEPMFLEEFDTDDLLVSYDAYKLVAQLATHPRMQVEWAALQEEKGNDIPTELRVLLDKASYYADLIGRPLDLEIEVSKPSDVKLPEVSRWIRPLEIPYEDVRRGDSYLGEDVPSETTDE